MPHLSHIGIQNFKIFQQKQDFAFKPITLFTGTNSSGKTSVIQALRLLTAYLGNKELYQENGTSHTDALETLSLEQIGERLGDFSKLVNKGSGDNTITFTIPTLLKGIIDNVFLTLKVSRSSGRLNEGELTGISLFSEKIQADFLSITKKEGAWSVRIHYRYFWEEFKREAAQQNQYRELEQKVQELRENSSSETVGGELSKAIEALEERKQAAHPQYYWYKQVLQLGTAPSGRNYVPFFEDYSIPSPFEQLLDEKIFSPDNDSEDWDGEENDIEPLSKEEKRRKTSEELEAMIKRVAFTQKYHDYLKLEAEALSNNGETGRMWRDMEEELLEGFSFSYNPIQKKQVLRQALNLIGRPTSVLNSKSSEIDWEVNGFLSDYIRIGGYQLALFESTENGFDELLTGPSTATLFFQHFVGNNILFALQSSSDYFSAVGYLSSIRNIVKRAYGNRKEETEFTELILEFLKNNIEGQECIVAFVNDYLRYFNVGDKILIERDTEGVNNRFYVLKQEEKILLADLGYGISQFMPILLKIAVMAFYNQSPDKNSFAPSTMCVEEPETNLHPALQSKLADMFVEAYRRFNIQFIVETHSEYLIRKLQYLTANHSIEAENLLLYYFEQEGSDMERGMKAIKIKADGSLSDDFGPGFFDEALRWKFELVKLSNAQSN